MRLGGGPPTRNERVVNEAKHVNLPNPPQIISVRVATTCNKIKRYFVAIQIAAISDS